MVCPTAQPRNRLSAHRTLLRPVCLTLITLLSQYELGPKQIDHSLDGKTAPFGLAIPQEPESDSSAEIDFIVYGADGTGRQTWSNN